MAGNLSRRDKKLVEQKFLKTLYGSIDKFVVDHSDDKTEWSKNLTRYVNELAVKFRKKIEDEPKNPFNSDYWIGYCNNSPSKIRTDVFDAIVKTFNEHVGLPERGQDEPEGTTALHDLFWDKLSVKFLKKNPFKGCDDDRARAIKKKIDDDFYEALCVLFDGLDNIGRARYFHAYDDE